MRSFRKLTRPVEAAPGAAVSGDTPERGVGRTGSALRGGGKGPGWEHGLSRGSGTPACRAKTGEQVEGWQRAQAQSDVATAAGDLDSRTDEAGCDKNAWHPTRVLI